VFALVGPAAWLIAGRNASPLAPGATASAPKVCSTGTYFGCGRAVEGPSKNPLQAAAGYTNDMV